MSILTFHTLSCLNELIVSIVAVLHLSEISQADEQKNCIEQSSFNAEWLLKFMMSLDFCVPQLKKKVLNVLFTF